jgi:hypothetical protein
MPHPKPPLSLILSGKKALQRLDLDGLFVWESWPLSALFKFFVQHLPVLCVLVEGIDHEGEITNDV